MASVVSNPADDVVCRSLPWSAPGSELAQIRSYTVTNLVGPGKVAARLAMNGGRPGL